VHAHRFADPVGVPSEMRLACRETALARSETYDLFGGCPSDRRSAGLPNPGEAVRAYPT